MSTSLLCSCECCACRNALLEGCRAGGAAYVIGAKRQYNAAIVVSRGASSGAGMGSDLAAAAQHVAEQAGFRFDAGSRAARGLLRL